MQGWSTRPGYGTYRAGTARISLDGLSADTEYIAYFVLKGEAQDSYSGVYAFRFKTEVVTRPGIDHHPDESQRHDSI